MSEVIYIRTHLAMLNSICATIESVKKFNKKNLFHDMDDIVFAKEFATSFIGGSRRSGKTSSIIETAKLFKNPLIVTHCHDVTTTLSNENPKIKIMSASMVSEFDSVGVDHDVIFVDESTYCKQKDLDGLYERFAHQCKNIENPFIFVLVGTGK